MTPIVILILENDKGEILLQQRPAGVHLAGLWEFPGGKVESGETELQALRRELKEELNYAIKNPQLITRLTHHYPKHSIELIAYHQIDPSPLLKAAENQPLRWVAKRQLHQYPTPQANQAIIDRLTHTQH